MTELRNVSFSGMPVLDAELSAQNARDTNSALSERVPTRVYGPVTYTAVGATTAKIPVKCPARPAGVLLLNAYLVTSPGDDLGASMRCNFYWDADTRNAYVYEPSGLTADTAYVLTFLVVG